MGIPIDIPGLKQFIKIIPKGSLILIEGTIEPVFSIFVQKLAVKANQNGQKVVYITSRAQEEVNTALDKHEPGANGFEIVEERSHRYWSDHIEENSVLIIDSFSYLILDRQLIGVREMLEEFLKLCKQKHAIVILTVEMGMLDEKVEITIAHLADGIIRFLSKDTSEGVARFMRIPKWLLGASFNENIYYTFDGRRINVDVRSRVR